MKRQSFGEGHVVGMHVILQIDSTLQRYISTADNTIKLQGKNLPTSKINVGRGFEHSSCAVSFLVETLYRSRNFEL